MNQLKMPSKINLRQCHNEIIYWIICFISDFHTVHFNIHSVKTDTEKSRALRRSNIRRT